MTAESVPRIVVQDAGARLEERRSIGPGLRQRRIGGDEDSHRNASTKLIRADRHALPSAGLQHDQPNQVVDNGINGQLLENSRLGFAVKHVHAKRRFQVGEIGLDFHLWKYNVARPQQSCHQPPFRDRPATFDISPV